MASFFRLSRRNIDRWRLTWRVAALLLACNYFAFRTELFNDEYEKNHPSCDPFSHQVSFTLSTLTWETFDKDNAPKAITIHANTQITFISFVVSPRVVSQLSFEPYQPVRDKSPPVLFLSLHLS